MELTLLISATLLSLLTLIIVLVKLKSNTSNDLSKDLERFDKTIKDEFQRNRLEFAQLSKTNRDELNEAFVQFKQAVGNNIRDLNELLRQKFSDFNVQQQQQHQQIKDGLKDIRQTVENQLKEVRSDNTNQLNEMRKTVDEKLQSTLEKRLGESFKQVSERLEQVHKGLGEMQTIASGVGDLKRVLSNVKTRGVLGEYQLANILEQLLTPDQYAKNVATKKGSQAHVEFALKLPGKSSDKEVWLPIDSKFPIESYELLLQA